MDYFDDLYDEVREYALEYFHNDPPPDYETDYYTESFVGDVAICMAIIGLATAMIMFLRKSRKRMKEFEKKDKKIRKKIDEYKTLNKTYHEETDKGPKSVEECDTVIKKLEGIIARSKQLLHDDKNAKEKMNTRIMSNTERMQQRAKITRAKNVKKKMVRRREVMKCVDSIKSYEKEVAEIGRSVGLNYFKIPKIEEAQKRLEKSLKENDSQYQPVSERYYGG